MVLTATFIPHNAIPHTSQQIVKSNFHFVAEDHEKFSTEGNLLSKVVMVLPQISPWNSLKAVDTNGYYSK